jgi:hypothetical protein
MGIRLISDTTTAVRARREGSGRRVRCHMKGPTAIVASYLEECDRSDGVAFPPRARTYPEPPMVEA